MHRQIYLGISADITVLVLLSSSHGVHIHAEASYTYECTRMHDHNMCMVHLTE